MLSIERPMVFTETPTRVEVNINYNTSLPVLIDASEKRSNVEISSFSGLPYHFHALLILTFFLVLVIGPAEKKAIEAS